MLPNKNKKYVLPRTMINNKKEFIFTILKKIVAWIVLLGLIFGFSFLIAYFFVQILDLVIIAIRLGIKVLFQIYGLWLFAIFNFLLYRWFSKRKRINFNNYLEFQSRTNLFLKKIDLIIFNQKNIYNINLQIKELKDFIALFKFLAVTMFVL